jgi:two-component system cell cycle sensor histidine kinase/response regulator CckA
LPYVGYVRTVLEVLAGVSLLLGLVMALSWRARGGYPGFGLWTVSNVLIAGCSLVLAHGGYFPMTVIVVILPWVVVGAASARLCGLRWFLGIRRFDYAAAVLPVVALGLLLYFWYGSRSDVARAVVAAACIAVAYAIMASAAIPWARRDHSLFGWLLGTLFAGYGGLLIAYAIFWSVVPDSLPITYLSRPSLALGVLLVTFEVAWVIILLTLGNSRETSKLEAARAAAEGSRRQLAAMVDFLPDATFAVDTDLKVIGWNRALEALTGIPAAAVLGRSWPEEARPALASHAETLIDLVLGPSREIPVRYLNGHWDGDKLSAEREIRFPIRPNQTLHLWLTATAIRDSRGSVIGAIESMRDLGSLEQAVRVIRQREYEFRSLFELNLAGVLAIAPDGSICDANPAACEMLGMTREEICVAGGTGIIKWEADAQGRVEMPTLLGHEKRELTFVRKDKGAFLAECMSVAYIDGNGLPRAFVEFRDVTEQREAQSILRQSEARLSQAVAAAQIGNWEIDLVAHSLWLSPEALRIHGLEGLPPYFPLGQAEKRIFFDDPGPVVATMRELARGSGPFELEYRHTRNKDGSSRWLRARGEAVKDDDDRLMKIIGVVQDVTELRQVEGALRLAQYSVDHSDDQIFWLDSMGRVTYASDSSCTQLCYAREDLLTRAFTEIDVGVNGDWPELWSAVREAGMLTRETVLCASDGRRVPVELSMSCTSDGDGQSCFVSARDISKRKEMEEVLRRSQVTANYSDDQVFWISPESRVVFVSDAACRRLGYTREELLGMSIYDLDPTLSKDWNSLWETTKQRGSVRREGVHRTKDGQDIPIEVSINRISLDGQEYDLIFARDIDDGAGDKEAMALGEEKLTQERMLDAIGQLAGGIAHDFTNLLTAIVGYGDLILASEDTQELVSCDAAEIKSAALRASALTNQVLAFARRQTLRPEVVTLNDLVSRATPRLRETLGDLVHVDTVLQSEPSHVRIDVDQFEHVLANLASNSHEAMPRGGRVVIEVRDVYLDEDYCGVYSDLQPGNYVLLSFADTGKGMNSETMAHVFEPFFTTKALGTGSGLGLSAVYGTVRQSGGYINVYSEEGEGTTVKIYLPWVPARPKPEPRESPAARLSPTSGTETILLVEDEAQLRKLVARVLGSLGYRVFVAGTGPEALELLDDLEQPPDLLVTDVILPGGMLGPDVAQAFAGRVPGLRVLFVSGHARDAIVRAGHLDEEVEFLGKPFTPESLAGKVRQVLDTPG